MAGIFALSLITLLSDDEIVHVFQDVEERVMYVGTKASYAALRLRGEPTIPPGRPNARWLHSVTRRAFVEGRPQPGNIWTEADGIWRVVIADWDDPRGVIILDSRQYSVLGIAPRLTVTPDPLGCSIQAGLLAVL